MEGSQTAYLNSLENLFRDAKSAGGLEYLYTLVRVSGISYGVPDPLLRLRTELEKNLSSFPEEAVMKEYCSIAGESEPLALLANLLRCAQGQPYLTDPFHHLRRGTFPRISTPTQNEIVQEVSTLAANMGRPEIANLVGEAYPEEALAACSSPSHALAPDRLRAILRKCRDLLASMLMIYFRERMAYRDAPKLHKLAKEFAVMELLVNEEFGLYGFQMHFSNGTSATFARYPDSTECTNVMPRDTVGYFVGPLEELRDEYRVGTKRLYEVGLPGRYNNPGEWKPLVYPGKSDILQNEAMSASSDLNVQGALFYMMCTGHRGIEFVVRTSIDLPWKDLNVGGKLHLWKCPPAEKGGEFGQAYRIYDGWFVLDSVEPQAIRSALEAIDIFVNRLAFTYRARAQWRCKYTIVFSAPGYATPSEGDLNLFQAFLSSFPTGEDQMVLDAAIDWYLCGRHSGSALTEFLCYYIAIESVAVAVAEGRASLGLAYDTGTKAERKARIIACIHEKHAGLFAREPIRFVTEGYLQCVRSLKEKTKRIVELVFGAGNPYIPALFERQEGLSLSEIRGRLAHGGLTALNEGDLRVIEQKLPEIQQITWECLARLTLRLGPSDRLPSWSGTHALSISMDDPRSTLVTTDETILPRKDWRIRPEWCE